MAGRGRAGLEHSRSHVCSSKHNERSPRMGQLHPLRFKKHALCPTDRDQTRYSEPARIGGLVDCSKVASRPEADKSQVLCSHSPPKCTCKPRVLLGEGHGNICGFRRMKRVSSPRSQPLLFAGPQPNLETLPLPRPPSAVMGWGSLCPQVLWNPCAGTQDSGVPYHGLGGWDMRPALPSRQRQEGRQHQEEPSDGIRRKGCGHCPGGSHSSLWSGRHWGQSFSSRTPSGAHTQGSWVSHCHLASWVWSRSRSWA